MSLSKRMNDMERRLRALEEWKAEVEQAITEDASAPVGKGDHGDDVPDQHYAGERDQSQSLG